MSKKPAAPSKDPYTKDGRPEHDAAVASHDALTAETLQPRLNQLQALYQLTAALSKARLMAGAPRSPWLGRARKR
jgi:hypothetical protein